MGRYEVMINFAEKPCEFQWIMATASVNIEQFGDRWQTFEPRGYPGSTQWFWTLDDFEDRKKRCL
jgi:hypothetical protein